MADLASTSLAKVRVIAWASRIGKLAHLAPNVQHTISLTLGAHSEVGDRGRRIHIRNFGSSITIGRTRGIPSCFRITVATAREYQIELVA